MQLPFVLQSAQVMKAAVAELEPYHGEGVRRRQGVSMLLATVRGDVHDIGKNLVDIILTNNGYTVHNLGIKVPINEIVAKYKELKPDAIGLSGLLVKSVNVMEENLKELNSPGPGPADDPRRGGPPTQPTARATSATPTRAGRTTAPTPSRACV